MRFFSLSVLTLLAGSFLAVDANAGCRKKRSRNCCETASVAYSQPSQCCGTNYGPSYGVTNLDGTYTNPIVTTSGEMVPAGQSVIVPAGGTLPTYSYPAPGYGYSNSDYYGNGYYGNNAYRNGYSGNRGRSGFFGMFR